MSGRGNQAGFTLVEVMVSVAIMALLAGLALPVYESFLRRNDLDLTTQSVASALRRAQLYARANNGDSVWGVAFQPTDVVLYKGASYAARASGYDERIVLPASITSSYQGEVTFAKLSATPSTTGSVILTSTTNDSRVITLNAKGMVDY